MSVRRSGGWTVGLYFPKRSGSSSSMLLVDHLYSIITIIRLSIKGKGVHSSLFSPLCNCFLLGLEVDHEGGQA